MKNKINSHKRRRKLNVQTLAGGKIISHTMNEPQDFSISMIVILNALKGGAQSAPFT